jgi:hypothetical protein
MGGSPADMAYKQPQHTTPETTISHLRIVRHQGESAQSRYRHFGALLQSLRDRIGHTRDQMVATLASSFQEEDVQELSPKTYGNLERDDRFPQYDELWPIVHGLVKTCKACNVQFSVTDGNDFYELARSKVDSSKKWRRSEADWQRLKKRIDDFVDTTSSEDHYPDPSEEVTKAKQEEAIRETQEKKAKLLSQLGTDTSHIFGREQWIEHMLSFLELQATTRKKVVVIQAVIGAGKTSCLKLIQKRLLEDAKGIHVIFHECKKPVDLD